MHRDAAAAGLSLASSETYTVLATGADYSKVLSMVFAEIKPQIEQLSRDEMLKAMAYLKHLLRAENPVYQAEIAQRHAELDAGRGITLTEAKRRLEKS